MSKELELLSDDYKLNIHPPNQIISCWKQRNTGKLTLDTLVYLDALAAHIHGMGIQTLHFKLCSMQTSQDEME